MSQRPFPGRRSVLRGSLVASAALTLPAAAGAAPAFALSGRPEAGWGVQTGDVSAHSGLVWVRSDRPARMIVETSATESFRNAHRWHGPLLGAGTDFTGTTRLHGLPAGEQIHYRVLLADPDDPRRTGEPVTGTFRTASAGRRDGVRFLWSGDLAGQGWGINPDFGGYTIYKAMAALDPDFFLCSGDNIYADGPISATATLPDGSVWRNVTTEEKAKVAETLAEFRGNFRYNLLDRSSFNHGSKNRRSETEGPRPPGQQTRGPPYTRSRSLPVRIHRTRHTRDFTVVPNATARNRSLSFTARGLWLHLISLPDGAKEDVRTLADRNPGVGRKGVANALDELVAAGYYFRFTIRDPETGKVWTETAIHDMPQTEVSPVPASPATGRPGSAEAGTLPTGVKNSVSKELEKTPSLPSVTTPEAPAAPAAWEGDTQQDPHGESPALGEASRVLARLEDVDARLRLTGRQLRDLAPLASQWLARGYSAPEITDAVVQGLPATVWAPAKIVADRLTRKLPAPRRKWRTFADCSDGCGRVLPAGQGSGQCGVCAGTTPAPFLQELAAQALQELDATSTDAVPDVKAHADGLRNILRSRRSAVASA